MRPRKLGEIVGQAHLVGADAILFRMAKARELSSMLFWGPPGCGKTTLARIVAGVAKAEFVAISAVMAGVKDLREIVTAAQERLDYQRASTVLFIDEVHRFNKAQQDALLPHVESGLLTLIGATTENPSFEVNSALLSRCRVLTLRPLETADLVTLLGTALKDHERGLGAMQLKLTDEAMARLATAADGDARRALGALEVCATVAVKENLSSIDLDFIAKLLPERHLRYDRRAEEHYTVISAFIKSMRASDVDAALYWLARMLEAGEDPRFICRRMAIFASEDIGNADPQALIVAQSAHAAFELIGLPEGALTLTQAAAYLASAPKSRAVINAQKAAAKDARERGSLPVPMHLRNAVTALNRSLGYGQGKETADTNLPQELADRRYWED